LTHGVVLLDPFNGLFSSLHLNEARDDEILRSSGISWTICKQSAPRSRQINTPTPHHFFRPDALPNAQPKVSALTAQNYKVMYKNNKLMIFLD